MEYQKKFTENDLPQRPKKFVFQIYPEHIDFVESFSYQEKQDFINSLITEYRSREDVDEEEENSNRFKKTLVYVAAIVIGIPLIMGVLSLSFEITKSSYQSMTHNFESLFNK